MAAPVPKTDWIVARETKTIVHRRGMADVGCVVAWAAGVVCAIFFLGFTFRSSPSTQKRHTHVVLEEKKNQMCRCTSMFLVVGKRLRTP